jgi:sugar lactone lactonase YvrE
LGLFAGSAGAQPQIYNWHTIAGKAGTNTFGHQDGTNGNASFFAPACVATDTSGELFVTDGLARNNTVRKIVRIGTNWVTSTIAGLALTTGSADGTNSAARFNIPQGIAVDPAGNVFVADTGNATIRKLTPVGTNWVTSTIAGLAGPPGSADGTNNAARFAVGGGELAMDTAGALYFADWANNTIRKIAPAGTNWVTTTIAGLPGVAGHADGTNSAARFYNPNGVAVDGAGVVYVADSGNNGIRSIVPAGIDWVTTTIAGKAGYVGELDGTNDAARFNDPYYVAEDGAGTLYVTDYNGRTIRRISPMGTNWITTTIGGLNEHYGTADGTNSAARFGNPYGLALDGRGNLFVVDSYNNAIRMGVLLPWFQMVTQAGQQIEFNWLAVPGQTFQVQFIADLMSTNWTNLGGPLTATNGTAYASDALGPDGGRFYRIELVP